MVPSLTVIFHYNDVVINKKFWTITPPALKISYSILHHAIALKYCLRFVVQALIKYVSQKIKTEGKCDIRYIL